MVSLKENKVIISSLLIFINLAFEWGLMFLDSEL